MPLELRARLSDSRLDAAAPESQRMLFIEISAPVGDGAALPLNLGLALDKSGSMQGYALDCLKQAAKHIVRSLSARDRVALVAFNDEPEVMLASRPVVDSAAPEAAIDRLAAGGGTCIDGGMDLALRELRKAVAPSFMHHSGPGPGPDPAAGGPFVNRVFVLTDGHNQHGDDDRCVALARQAVRDHITFSAFGIGEKFSVNVLRDVVNAGNGMLHHVLTPGHIEEAFRKELAGIQRIGATQVRLTVRLADGVELAAKDPVCMVSPAIVVQEVEREPGAFHVNLGDMPADGPVVLLATVYLKARAEGPGPVASLEAAYVDSDGSGRQAPVEVAGRWVNPYVQDVDPEVAQAIARMAIYKQRQKAIEVAGSNPDMARTMLQSATELAGQAGNEELRTVLQQTLTELQRDGRISDKTMIHGEVASRTVLQEREA